MALLIALAVHSEPPMLELGRGAPRAVLRIDAPSRPRLVVNVGSVNGLREESPGKWVAQYVPPRPSYPQVALVAAVAGGDLAWTAIPLWGHGVAEVHTRAFASISVDIGPRSFGPVESDENGVARVPVVVPPGTHEARHKRQRIPLPMPDSLRVMVVAIDEGGRADREQRFALRVLAVDDAGEPRADAPLRLRPARGQVSRLAAVGRGEWRATWTVPPGASGPLAIAASLAETPELTSRAIVQLDGGPATSLELSADRDAVTAGESNQVALRGRARDAVGNASPEPLQLDAPDGFQVQSVSASEWRVVAPDFFGGRKTVELVAHPAGRSQPRATVSVKLLPGKPASAEIEPELPFVRVGGTLRLRVTRSDRFGNPVPGAPAAAAEEGQVEEIAPLPDGAYAATYVPPTRWKRGDGWVEMRWPQTQARRELQLLPAFARLAISPKLGAVSNFARLTSPLAAVEGSIRTRAFDHELAISAETGWYYVSQSAGSDQARDDFFHFSAQLAMRFKAGSRNVAWVGAGPTLTAVATRVKVGTQPELSQSALLPGAIVSAGLERKFVAATPFAELRWSWHRDPSLSNLTGAVTALSLVLGARLEIL